MICLSVPLSRISVFRIRFTVAFPSLCPQGIDRSTMLVDVQQSSICSEVRDASTTRRLLIPFVIAIHSGRIELNHVVLLGSGPGRFVEGRLFVGIAKFYLGHMPHPRHANCIFVRAQHGVRTRVFPNVLPAHREQSFRTSQSSRSTVRRRSIAVRRRMQLRTKLFNATNSVNSAGPQTAITSSAFGTISLTQVDNPGAIQFGLRVLF